jgi:glycosyltransferase involved in cell wall biosynthesis
LVAAHIAVIIPCLNEEEVIGAHVREVLAALASLPHTASAEVIVVDNGSSDRTATRAAEAGARVVTEPRRGYGRACLSGAEAASGSDILIYMDGDRSDDPADVPRVLGPVLDNRADLVVGSRLSGSYEPGSLTTPQRFGNWIGCKGLSLFYDVELTDFGPFRSIRRETLLALDMQEMTYGWPLEMLAKAGKQGLRVTNVPVTWRNRAGGTSKVSGNVRASLDTGRRYLLTLYRCR